MRTGGTLLLAVSLASPATSKRMIWRVEAKSALLSSPRFWRITFSPISYFWNQDQPGKCVMPEVIMALTYLYSVFSVISDFTCAILPMFLVFKLNMGRKTKLALIPIMAMACVLVYPPYYKRHELTSYRASAAVVVRFPFVKDFKNPDFLCKSQLQLQPQLQA